MSVVVNFTITDKGDTEKWSAKNNGLDLELTHIQFGSGNRIPGGDEVVLISPKQVVALSAGSRISGNQIRMSGVFSGDQQYEIREIGIWAGEPGANGSVLYAYWSTQAGMLATKYPGVNFAFNYDMVVQAGENITIVVAGDQASLAQIIGEHEAKPDPHPQYITAAELSAALAIERQARRARRFFHTTL